MVIGDGDALGVGEIVVMMGFEELLQLGGVLQSAGYHLVTDAVEVPRDTAAPASAA